MCIRDRHALGQWKFIPEEWVEPAAKRDYEYLFGNCLLYTSLTSQGFYNYLFPKLNRKNVLVQPNKLESSFMDYRRVCSPISTDRIIYFLCL